MPLPSLHYSTTGKALLFATAALVPLAEAQLFKTPEAGRQQDIELGSEYAKVIEQQMGLDDSSPAASDYIAALGTKLTRFCGDEDWNFSFKIVDQPYPNAFALPGGPIYVSRGMLALSCSEDELAGVIAHEIAHVTRRHTSKQMRKGLLPGVLALPGNVVGGVLSERLGDLVNLPVNVMGGAMLSSYSRKHETEADDYGIRTAARAGYDPSSMLDILQRLERDVEIRSGEEKHFSIFDSHPLTRERVRRIGHIAGDFEIGLSSPIARDHEDFLSKLDGIWWGENPAAGIFRGQQFLHPTLNVTMRFPRNWLTMNTPTQVVAIEPEQQGGIILEALQEPEEPRIARQAFISHMRDRARIEPIDRFELSVGNDKLYATTYLVSRSRYSVYLHFGWIGIGDHTFQITALGDDRQRSTIRDSATSIRNLTAAERDSITGLRIRIARAEAGERLSELSARYGNSWSPSYTALANNVDPDVPLKDGQPVKIARLERYR